jgi:hypothetical protein
MYLCCIEKHLKIKDMRTAENIREEFDRLTKKYKGEKYRTIWEIYCHQNDVDYNDDYTLEAITFDAWVLEKKSK